MRARAGMPIELISFPDAWPLGTRRAGAQEVDNYFQGSVVQHHVEGSRMAGLEVQMHRLPQVVQPIHARHRMVLVGQLPNPQTSLVSGLLFVHER